MFPYPVVESSLRGSSSGLPRQDLRAVEGPSLPSEWQWQRTAGPGSAADWGPRLSLLLCPGLSSSAAPGARHLGCKETGAPPSCPPRSPGCQGDNLNSGTPSSVERTNLLLHPTPVPLVHRQVLPPLVLRSGASRPGPRRAAPGDGQLPPVSPALPRPAAVPADQAPPGPVHREAALLPRPDAQRVCVEARRAAESPRISSGKRHPGNCCNSPQTLAFPGLALPTLLSFGSREMLLIWD